MDFKIFSETKKILNNPLIDSKLCENKHLIFVKYTSELYYKYTIELIESLCQKSKFENKKLLFHTTLHFILKILFNCGNKPCLNNFDLLILCSFSLAMKTIENQNRPFTINRLKRIYPEKYYKYDNYDIKLGEIISLKLLNFNITILTSYECLFYILNQKNNLAFLEKSIQYLDYIILHGDKNFFFKKPFDIAEEIIEKVKLKEKEKNQFLLYKSPNKLKLNLNHKIIMINNESISTNNSSNGNISNYVNSSIYSPQYKSIIKNKYTDNFNKGERYSLWNKTEGKNIKINLEFIDNNNKKDEYNLNTSIEKKRSIYIINKDLNNNANVITYGNNYLITDSKNKIKKNYNDKNCSSHNIFKKPINVHKKNAKNNLIKETQKSKAIQLSEKYKTLMNINGNNVILNEGNKKRTVNFNLSYGKLNELCKKLNFEVFSNKSKLNI